MFLRISEPAELREHVDGKLKGVRRYLAFVPSVFCLITMSIVSVQSKNKILSKFQNTRFGVHAFIFT